MDELTEQQLSELKQALLKLERELKELLDMSQEATETVSLDQPIGRLSRMDAIQQQKMAVANRANAQIRYQQVRAALNAIETEDYGYCKRCDEEIGFKRLSAKPEAPLCLNCQSDIETR